MRGVRGLSLRSAVALAIGTVGLAATISVGLLAGHETGERLRRDIGGDLSELAAHMADKLDRGMFERWREIQIVAGMRGISDASLPVAERRAALSRLAASYPDFAALLLVNPQGRVGVSSIQRVEGSDVSKRDYFTNGSTGPYVGDVHDAILLKADTPGGQPLRFVDFSAPISGPGGEGWVISAHLNWAWADRMRLALTEIARKRHPTADVLVLSSDGTVVLGPPSLLRSRIETLPVPSGEGAVTSSWPDGSNFLVGVRRTQGYAGYKGLGWNVIVREDAAASLAPVRRLQARIALWGGLVALLTSAIAWCAARQVTRPLLRLAEAADALGRGDAVVVPRRGPSEILRVGEALSRASTEIGDRQRRQSLLVNEMNHRVKNTLATVQSLSRLTARSAGGDIGIFQAGLESRIIALSKTHDLLTAASWESVLLGDILMNELSPYNSGPGRLRLEGEPVSLSPRAATAIGMAVHELATNAAKYGSLSIPGGTVAVSWEMRETEGGNRLHIAWNETGGPAVTAPTRKGFGSRLIKVGLAADLGGETTMEFAPEGLRCSFLLAVGTPRATKATKAASARETAEA